MIEFPPYSMRLAWGGRAYVSTDVRTYRFPLCSTGLRPPLGPKPKKGQVPFPSHQLRIEKKMVVGIEISGEWGRQKPRKWGIGILKRGKKMGWGGDGEDKKRVAVMKIWRSRKLGCVLNLKRDVVGMEIGSM